MTKFPESAAVFPYLPACLLRASGSDAATFLQGQFTNDLSRLEPGRSVYGLWLDRKGRVVADSHVVCAQDGAGFWIVSISSPAPVVARRLGDYIVADDVVIEDATAAWRGLSLIGEGTGSWLAGEPRAGMCFRGRRDSGENWEWVFAAGDSQSVDAAVSGARRVGRADVERMRIASGIPSVPADIGPADLPNEGGLDAQAISYSKGCYLGQEVMARLKSMGRVRRTLVRVKGRGTTPPVPAALWRGDRREGELRSAVSDAGGGGYAGLALVPVAAGPGDGPLSLVAGGRPSVEIAGNSDAAPAAPECV
jgi:folate-binding protein YgfZ